MREFLLGINDFDKSQVEYLTKLTSHIDSEGDLDAKTINDISNYSLRSKSLVREVRNAYI